MRKIYSFLLLTTLLLFGGNAWAEDVTVTIASSTDVGTGTTAAGSNSVSKSGITVSCTAGGFAISGGAHYRLASNSTTTISSTVGNIQSIVINGATGTGSNSISKFGDNDGWTVNSTKGTCTWTGDAASVTIKANGGQVRPTSFVVTYTPLTTPFVNVTPTSLNFGTVPEDIAVAAKTFSVTGSNLTGAISIAAPSGYSVDPTSITPTAGAISATTVTVTPNTETAGTFNGNVTISGGGLASAVNVAVSMTVATPMTVTEARAAMSDAGADVEIPDKIVRGIVCGGGSNLSNSGSMHYFISDDGTTTNQIQIYYGKGLNGANFSAETDIEVGDIVVVAGTLEYYNGSNYQFNGGSQIKSLIEIQDNDLEATGSIDLSMATPSVKKDVHDYISTSSDGAFTFTSANTSIAQVTSSGIVTPVAAGTTTIKVLQARTSTYKADSTTVTVVVAAASKTDNAIVLSKSSSSTVYGTPVNLTYEMEVGYDGSLTAVVSPAAIADVEVVDGANITITPKAVGTATITFSAAETALFNAADDEIFNLTVTAPAGGSTAAVATTTLWTETWDKTLGEGGNDGTWSGTMTTVDVVADQTGWEYETEYGSAKCVRLGKSKSGQGVATTPAFGATGKIIVVFKAGAWDGGSESTTLNLSVSGDGTIDKSSVTLTKGAFNEFTATITGAAADSKMVFTGNAASNARFFLDSVVVKKAGVDLSVQLNSYGYATYCSEYPLDFSDHATAGYSAWQVTDIDGSTITFSQITGSVKGGTGILLKGTANAKITLNSVNSTNTLNDNLLDGTLAPTYVSNEADYYVLSGNEFQSLATWTGTIPAHKAFLINLGAPAPGALRIEFEENNTTDISNLSNDSNLSNAIKFFENGNLYILREGVVYDVTGRIVK